VSADLPTVELELEDIAGKKSVEKAFFASVSSSGSPDGKLNIDDPGDGMDCISAVFASNVESIADVVAALAMLSEVVPFVNT
jgi:hypothetical protein